jgi:hypothetical protein
MEEPGAGDSESDDARHERPLSGVAADALSAMVDVVVETEKMAAMLAGMRAEQINKSRRLAELSVRVVTSDGMKPWSQAETARRTLLSELACALRLPEVTIGKLIYESQVLVEVLPATLGGLQVGAFSYRHAAIMIDHAMSLPAEQRTKFESTVLAAAALLTAAQFERKARTVRERMDPETITERHAKSVIDRRLQVENSRDGMAWLQLFLPATEAHAIYARSTEIAIALQNKDEQRTLTQLRADVAADLLLDGGITGRGEFAIRPTVTVTVPVLSLLGHDDEPAILDGYGPIDLDTARDLVAKAPSLLRVLTHPETGVTLSVGSGRFPVPAGLRSWLQYRDGTCRKPGCNRAARRCDIDHTEEVQHGGWTTHNNLAHMCPHHHAEKHHTGWAMKQLAAGRIEWTSPTGHVYFSEPDIVIRT